MSIVFKLTYYHHGGIFEEVPSTAPTEARINFAIHQVLTKILLTPKSEEQSQKILISLGEIIYSQDKQVSTKRVSRIMIYLSMLFKSTEQLNSSSKFLPGMLYTLGGLLKVEARNYLETKQKQDPNFQVAGPIRESSNEAEKLIERTKRELSPPDISFFET